MSSAPLFSVIVPTFERPKQLASCLASLTGQDFSARRFEILVVDDGSSAPVAAEVATIVEGSGGRLLRQSNRGPAAARNHGAREARGDYLVFTDDDCVAAPNWLARLAAAFERSPEHAVGGRTVNLVVANAFSEASQLLIEYLYGYYGDRRGAFFTSNNVALPRSTFEAIGGFDERFRIPAAEDRELCDRLRFHGYPSSYDEAAVVYHHHALTLRSFWRQHLQYGQGAWHYHTVRAEREAERVRLEPVRFYRQLLAFPFTRERSPSAFIHALLLGLSQVATGTGFFYERVRQIAARNGG